MNFPSSIFIADVRRRSSPGQAYPGMADCPLPGGAASPDCRRKDTQLPRILAPYRLAGKIGANLKGDHRCTTQKDSHSGLVLSVRLTVASPLVDWGSPGDRCGSAVRALLHGGERLRRGHSDPPPPHRRQAQCHRSCDAELEPARQLRDLQRPGDRRPLHRLWTVVDHKRGRQRHPRRRQLQHLGPPGRHVNLRSHGHRRQHHRPLDHHRQPIDQQPTRRGLPGDPELQSRWRWRASTTTVS